MIDKANAALNEQNDKEELIEKLHELIKEYRNRMKVYDISGAFDYVHGQLLAFHFGMAMDMTKKDMEKLKEKGTS